MRLVVCSLFVPRKCRLFQPQAFNLPKTQKKLVWSHARISRQEGSIAGVSAAVPRQVAGLCAQATVTNMANEGVSRRPLVIPSLRSEDCGRAGHHHRILTSRPADFGDGPLRLAQFDWAKSLMRRQSY